VSDPTGSGRRLSIAETVQTTDTFLRHAGREFLVVLYATLRSLKLYPIENAQVQKSLDDLAASARHLLDVEHELEVRLQGEFIFVNSTRLRLDLDNYASFSHILSVFRQCGVGAVRVAEGVDRRQLAVFVSLLLSFAATEATPGKIYDLGQKMIEGGITRILLEPPVETEENLEESERQKEAAKRTYTQGVAVTREVVNSIRMGRTANVKRVKRAVQAIVDQVLNNESSLMGLTTIRDYDEYTFTHSVNVCIFSIALGRKLGLTKLQLYDLGMAALFHDVGKARVPLEVLNKEGGLTEEEWRIMQAHPWLGVLTLFGRTLEQLRIRHVRTQVNSPWTNGKIERFWGVLQAELLDRQLFPTLEAADEALMRFAIYYDYHRLHGELDWHTPAERYEGTPFTDQGFEHVPALEHLQGWLTELMAA